MELIATYKVEDIFSGRITGAGIYVVGDGDTTIYVGKSEWNLDARLKAHLGLYGQLSMLGYFIQANSPESRKWDVRIYWAEGLNQLEFNLIQQLRPILNEQMNTQAHSIPERYKTEIQPRKVDIAKSIASRIK
jgi:excinuclease UvrABC nuclease subunit